KEGAKNIYAGCTHGGLCEDACERIQKSPMSEFVTTNTIQQNKCRNYSKITVLSVAELFGDAIVAIHMGTSVSKLFP
ncbi:MAG: ribose-phosphate pyrophosphokinase, partial [Candidatus Latescibacteria bacterium]|nr:ribose-phosphate pyrophosphokinase [Candidatus Latescibacterota bacterium]